jgi:hypothetical protein
MGSTATQRAREATRTELHRKVSDSFSMDTTTTKLAAVYQLIHESSK